MSTWEDIREWLHVDEPVIVGTVVVRSPVAQAREDDLSGCRDKTGAIQSAAETRFPVHLIAVTHAARLDIFLLVPLDETANLWSLGGGFTRKIGLCPRTLVLETDGID